MYTSIIKKTARSYTGVSLLVGFTRTGELLPLVLAVPSLILLPSVLLAGFLCLNPGAASAVGPAVAENVVSIEVCGTLSLVTASVVGT